MVTPQLSGTPLRGEFSGDTEGLTTSHPCLGSRTMVCSKKVAAPSMAGQ